MEPVRTCVGCRKPDNRANLQRFVISSQELVLDEKKSLPGRGAWVHQQCLQLAQDRGAFARALKKRQK
ncbi:MAG: YlxR family protein [Micrococcales bacterium]